MDWPLTIFVLAVIAVSLGYWWYRQKEVKSSIESLEDEERLEEEKKGKI